MIEPSTIVESLNPECIRGRYAGNLLLLFYRWAWRCLPELTGSSDFMPWRIKAS